MALYDEDLRDAPLVARAWRNELEGWLALGAGAGTESVFQVERVDGMVCAWWRGKERWLENNLLVPAETPRDLDSMLRSVAERVDGSLLRTTLRFLAPGNLQAWTEAARERGYYHDFAAPLMVAELDTEPPVLRARKEISVATVETDEDHSAALDVVRRVYRDPPGLTEFFNPTGATRMYLARWEGVPAASATLWPFAGVAGVYSVATLPEYRGRGLASATVGALLRDARRMNFDLAFLRTAYDLIPLYERAGFRFVGNLQHFRHAAPIWKAMRMRDED